MCWAAGWRPVTRLAAVADSAVGDSATGTAAGASKKPEVNSLFAPLEPDEMAAYVAIDGKLAARIVLRDVPRYNAKQSIAQLRELGVKEETMLTGDKKASAMIIANEVGITDVRYELLPQDKVNAVREAAAAEKTGRESGWKRFLAKLLGEPIHRDVTMMVGDGVNDSPVLAVADIGMAMTDGTSTAASESAEVVIMNDDIGAVPLGVKIARQTKQRMLQAVLIGIALAIVGMVCAAFNLIPVVVGAFLQEAIDVVSILWALTALFNRKQASHAGHPVLDLSQSGKSARQIKYAVPGLSR